MEAYDYLNKWFLSKTGMGTYQCKNASCREDFKLGFFLEMGGDDIDKSLCQNCIVEIDEIRGFLTQDFTGLRRTHYFCRKCSKIIRRNIDSSNPEKNSRYCFCQNSHTPMHLRPSAPKSRIDLYDGDDGVYDYGEGY